MGQAPRARALRCDQGPRSAAQLGRRPAIRQARAGTRHATHAASDRHRRPAQESYDMIKHPDHLSNLAAHTQYTKLVQNNDTRLTQHLTDTADPRMSGQAPWDGYPYYFGDFWKKAKAQ